MAKSIQHDRDGTTLAELLVAATLLVTGLTLISTGAVQTQRLRQETRHYQLALDDLANQLERLVALPSAQRAAALDSLQPSERLRSLLVNATMKASVVNDEHGERIILSLQWDRRGPASPVALVGWLPPAISVANPDEDQS